jgi:crossover junction endodeoxyribonuclease RuvC
MRVISIDPGYDRCGVAILEKDNKNKEQLIFSTCLQPSKEDEIYVRIGYIGDEIRSLITRYKPDAMAVEDLFFSKNTKTALQVGQALGVISYTAYVNNIPVYNYKPNQIKVAVTGYGRAEKRDIHKMVQHIVKLDDKKYIDDEIDAIAVGITFLASYKQR